MRRNKRKKLAKEDVTTKSLFDVKATIAREFFERSVYPFEVLSGISDIIKSLSEEFCNDYEEVDCGIFIHKNAIISKNAVIKGPCIICENAEIRCGAYIRGNAIIGKSCVVGNSTEVKNSVLFDGAKAPHFNYVGDSVLGKNAHIGAGVICSNLRLDGKTVFIKTKSGAIATDLRKVGVFLGDGAEIGCNSVLNPGCVVKSGEKILPLSNVF